MQQMHHMIYCATALKRRTFVSDFKNQKSNSINSIKFKNMKRLNSLFTVAMLAVSMVVVSLAATSCSNDDDNNNGGGESSILGTWSGRNGESLNTLTFKKDGTGTWVSQDYDSFWGTETETGTFSYEMIDESTGTF
ncbi:MAG: hypothetical protein K2H04_04625, partial [Bacteroidaceae bacterium]|nr:hypothetical protein [Bacteroidaceae bacterium]